MAQFAAKTPCGLRCLELHEAHTTPIAMERHFEEHVDDLYSGCTPEDLKLDEETSSGLDYDWLKLVTFLEEARVCALQHKVALLALDCFVFRMFETFWLAMDHAMREKLVLEGITRAMRLRDVHMVRIWCPESTLQNLTSRDGKEFLRILKCMLPSSIDSLPMKPIELPNPMLDPILSPSEEDLRRPGCELLIRHARSTRTYILSAIIGDTLLAYCELVPSRPIRSDVRFHLTLSGFIVNNGDVDNPSEALCVACGIPANVLPKGQMRECSRCRRMDASRRVRYCSKACQRQDWLAGRPWPHKLICGVPLSDATLPPIVIPAENAIPEPDPGYVRSPALRTQIAWLAKHDEHDYAIWGDATEEEPNVTFVDRMDRLIFRTARNAAMRNGDHAAVRIMYKMLCRLPVTLHDAIHEQLVEEFGEHVNQYRVRRSLAAAEETGQRYTAELEQFMRTLSI